MTATEMEDSAQSKSAPSAAIEPCEYMDEVRTIVSGIKGFAGDQIATETAHERLWWVKKVASKLTTDYHGQRWSKVFSETLDPDAMKGDGLIVARVLSTKPLPEAEKIYHKLDIIDLYQEQPQQLDKYLEPLINELLSYPRDPECPDEVVHISFKFLYLFTKTRGFKVIVRMLPHEVADLEPVLALINKQDATDFKTWETRYMLLLWLSMVSMIPFDMERLDSNASVDGQPAKLPIMERIINVGKEYLSVSDKCRDAAAYMLGRFMTRPDVRREKLPEFLDWSLQTLNNQDKEVMSGMTTISGVMSALCRLFKTGKREDLVDYAPTVLQQLMNIGLLTNSNSVLRKLGIKVIQRLGLTFLKAKVAKWRYERGQRSLGDAFTTPGSEPASKTAKTSEKEEDEEYDIPEEIEEIIEQLLLGLKDANTVVRWSAAKGIGRVTGRLPKELADEVVGSLLELFTIAETDSAWHGGCLALAELGRRGLLLPSRLDTVVPIIVKSLSYDEKRGHNSVGAHVRDAACYVCWAFARAYDPSHLLPYVTQISNALVIVFIFDREVNVRRAAAAAFQENVGRQGSFPHGIDILTTCDYFAVGNCSHCYLELSVYVSQFGDYTRALIDHLSQEKVNHWDGNIRDLTAQGLQRLTKKDPEYMAKTVLPQLLTYCSSMEVTLRHGAILAVAHITQALSQEAQTQDRSLTEWLGDESTATLRDIPQKLQDAKLLRGAGGELMRKAVCCLIQKLSMAKMPFHDQPVIEVWQSIIDDCIQHIEPEVVASASTAIPAFFAEYYCYPDGTVRPDSQEKILSSYLKGLTVNLENIRMGYASALGKLPQFFLRGQLDRVLQGLIQATEITEKESKWAEARRDAVTALASVCKTMGIVRDGNGKEVINSDHLHKVYSTLFRSMGDYTLDSRGDVGAWVREASMTALESLTRQTVETDPSLISEEISNRIFCHLLQQLSEKIDRTRSEAGKAFYRLLYHSPEVPHIPERDRLKIIFHEKLHEEELIRKCQESNIPVTERMIALAGANGAIGVDWACPSNTFRLVTQLLSSDTYAYCVLLGLTVSVGGLTESLVRHSSSSLLGYLRSISDDVPALTRFTQYLLRIAKDNQKVDRVTVPMLKMLDQLLTNDCFSVFTEEDSDSSFGSDIYEVLKSEMTKCGDPQKLLVSVDVYCGLLTFPKVKTKALQALCICLCHRYPIVRKNTGTKLYEAMVTYDNLVDDEKLDDIMTILSETMWDKPVAEVKPIRNELCDLCGVPRPMLKSAAPKPADAAGAPKK